MAGPSNFARSRTWDQITSATFLSGNVLSVRRIPPKTRETLTETLKIILRYHAEPEIPHWI